MGMRSLFGCSGFSSKPRSAPSGPELGHAEALGVRDLVEERARAVGSRVELRCHVRQSRAAQDVVAEHDAKVCVADEVPGQADGMGDAQRTALIAIRQVEPEVRAVGEQLDDVAHALPADDDQHLADAHARQRLQRVVDHRPVVDRQQVLVRDDREREQPRGGAAGEDDPLHRRSA